MLNVLYLIPSLEKSGGMERVLSQKVNFLSKSKNYSVTIITTEMEEGVSPFFSLDHNVKVVNFELFFNDKFQLHFFKKIIETKKILKTYRSLLLNYLEANNIDICISMGGKELEFLYKLNHPCKKIYEAHFSKGIRTRTLLAAKGNHLLWRLIAKFREFQSILQTRKLDKVIVLTEKSAHEWGFTNDNVIVIPNPSSFKPMDKYPDYDSKKVIAVGRLEFEKGFDLLLQAWCIIRLKYPEWTLNIFGDGSQKVHLEKMIIANNLQEYAFLKGVSQNISEELLKGSFLVLSSRYEGMPMVMLESMACGLPMVAFDCETGPAELIHSNDCGLLVKNGSVDDLANKIIQMIENDSERFNMSKAAKIKSEQYVIEKIMLRWEILFNKISNN